MNPIASLLTVPAGMTPETTLCAPPGTGPVGGVSGQDFAAELDLHRSEIPPQPATQRVILEQSWRPVDTMSAPLSVAGLAPQLWPAGELVYKSSVLFSEFPTSHGAADNADAPHEADKARGTPVDEGVAAPVDMTLLADSPPTQPVDKTPVTADMASGLTDLQRPDVQASPPSDRSQPVVHELAAIKGSDAAEAGPMMSTPARGTTLSSHWHHPFPAPAQQSPMAAGAQTASPLHTDEPALRGEAPGRSGSFQLTEGEAGADSRTTRNPHPKQAPENTLRQPIGLSPNSSEVVLRDTASLPAVGRPVRAHPVAPQGTTNGISQKGAPHAHADGADRSSIIPVTWAKGRPSAALPLPSKPDADGQENTLNDPGFAELSKGATTRKGLTDATQALTTPPKQSVTLSFAEKDTHNAARSDVEEQVTRTASHQAQDVLTQNMQPQAVRPSAAAKLTPSDVAQSGPWAANMNAAGFAERRTPEAAPDGKRAQQAEVSANPRTEGALPSSSAAHPLSPHGATALVNVDIPKPLSRSNTAADPGDADLAGLAGLGGAHPPPLPGGPAPVTHPAMAAQAIPLPTAPPDLAHQLAASIDGQQDGTVEITLSPEELGRVRLVLSSDDTALRMVIQADRPETLEMMRRHIDQLSRDFRDLGYGQIDFSFSQSHQEPDQRGFSEGRQPSGQAQDTANDAPIAAQPAQRTNAGVLSGAVQGSLDMRL